MTLLGDVLMRSDSRLCVKRAKPEIWKITWKKTLYLSHNVTKTFFLSFPRTQPRRICKSSIWYLWLYLHLGISRFYFRILITFLSRSYPRTIRGQRQGNSILYRYVRQIFNNYIYLFIYQPHLQPLKINNGFLRFFFRLDRDRRLIQYYILINKWLIISLIDEKKSDITYLLISFNSDPIYEDQITNFSGLHHLGRIFIFCFFLFRHICICVAHIVTIERPWLHRRRKI